MSALKKPNLFDYATSELSQDAFIAWLLAWADANYADCDPALHDCARDLVSRLLELCDVPEPDGYSRVELQLQKRNVDVLATLDDKVALLIEDKVDARQHSGQLERYREELGRKYGPENLACIYFKTGDQSNYDKVKSAGFAVFHRRDFLDLLRAHPEADSAHPLYHDYLTHLEGIERAFHAHRTQPVTEWRKQFRSWQGFMQEIRQRLGDGDWDYVPNPAGGFLGLWWKWDDGPEGSEVYLQLEDEKLCFKVVPPESSDGATRRRIRQAWHIAVMQASENSSLEISRPRRFGSGKYMTVAVIPDYLVQHADGRVDLESTIATIREAERIHAAAGATEF